MEDDLKDNATKNNESFGYGRPPHFFFIKEDDLKTSKSFISGWLSHLYDLDRKAKSKEKLMKTSNT